MFARIKTSASVLAAVMFFAGTHSAVADARLTGNCRGTFIGDDYGSFMVEVKSDGSVAGTVHSNASSLDMEVSGICSFGVDCVFTAIGKRGVPFGFVGKIDFKNRFIGK